MADQRLDDGHESDLTLEIAHLLFIDVVGYSKLLVNEQIELMQELNRIVRGTQCSRNAEASERMIRLPTGDGMVLIFFRSPEQPVHCALEISAALREWPRIQVRMGIHSGPVNQVLDVNDQLNVAGAGINIGQRVMDCGDAGHILLSKHIAEDLGQYRHWQPHLHDLGECEVKHGLRLQIFNLHKEGLGNPATPAKFLSGKRRSGWGSPTGRPGIGLLAAWALAAVVLVGGFWIFVQRGQKKPDTTIPEKSIAVLPFENRSSEKENAYFADGIQDEILTRLSKIADLKVISRTSTQHYKTVPENLRDIARELGVAHILEGSVQKSGGMVRVNVQLIKAATDSHIWADTFDRELTDIFSVESDVAKAIADQLRAKLSGREEQAISARPTNNPEAYHAYLRGLATNLKTLNTPATTFAAQKFLREAVRLDPKFALAWAQLSYVDALGYVSLNLQPTAALREEARFAAENAFALQPDLGEAVMAKGYYSYACIKDYDTAIRYFEQARRLLPNSSQIPISLAYVARRRGQWKLSDFYFSEAERLDPRNISLLTQHALFYLALRQFPEASRKCEQILAIVPDDLDTLALKANVAQAMGDLARAAVILAPLRPAPADTGPLETQVYQAILERRPEQIIDRLKQLLATPDPALGPYNGQLRFWLGWAQEVAGDQTGAEENWRQARAELEPFLKDQPDNDMLLGDLALIHMKLGDTVTALTLAERAMAANPVEKDAIAGPGLIEILARVTAQTADHDRATAALEKLLSIPYSGPLASQNLPLTRALLRSDPMFDPLRGDPRFQKLVAPNAPK